MIEKTQKKRAEKKRKAASRTMLQAFGLMGGSLMLLMLAGNPGLLSIPFGKDKSAEALSVPTPLSKPDIAPSDESFELAMAHSYRLNAEKSLNYNGLNVLSHAERQDAVLAAEIFDLQEKEAWEQATGKLANLANDDLRGHILGERYLSSSYTAKRSELLDWLENYQDLPQADRIYKIAKKSGSVLAKYKPARRLPIMGNLSTEDYRGRIYQSRKKRTAEQTRRYFDLKAEIRDLTQVYEPTNALKILSRKSNARLMDDVEYDRLRADIAAGYLYAGKYQKSAMLAETALERSKDAVPYAGWIAGLAAWKNNEPEKAVRYFEIASGSPYSTAWLKSSASFWLARLLEEQGEERKARNYLKIAAEYPRTFYGFMAYAKLDRKLPFNWEQPEISRIELLRINEDATGRRALLLLQAGRKDLAQQEFLYMQTNQDPALQRVLIAAAGHFKLGELAMRLGDAYTNENNILYDAALYPEADYDPYGGYKVDKALVHAVIRQESRFQTSAYNKSGATGLMQLMPDTARYILGRTYGGHEKAMDYLHRPDINMEFGQTYLSYLLNHKAVGNDLFSLAIAYNAGPGNLAKWKRERPDIEDPLFFIETIPFHETRAFVDRVLANYWIYRDRYDQAPHSLEAVLAGDWPRYRAQDSAVTELASR